MTILFILLLLAMSIWQGVSSYLNYKDEEYSDAIMDAFRSGFMSMAFIIILVLELCKPQ